MGVYVSNITSVMREPLSVTATQKIQNCRLVFSQAMKEGEAAIQRRRALTRVYRELKKRNYKAAVSLVKQLKAHPAGLLRGFGAAAPKVRRSSELKFTGEIEISSVQLVVDAILRSIKCSLEEEELVVDAILRSIKCSLEEEETEVSALDSGNEMDVGSYGSLLKYHLTCMQVRGYKVPSVEDLLQDKFAHGRVEFIGLGLRDVGADTMSNKNFFKRKPNKETLKLWSTLTLGGMAAEHLVFGRSIGHRLDVQELVTVLEWMGFTEKEVDSETRRAAEAAVLILSRQSEARSMVAEAMALGKSVGFCIETIERALNLNDMQYNV